MTMSALEKSYLKHILIAAEVRDLSAPFRTFFDSWFAFRQRGPFLNANSRPHWFNNPDPNRHSRALHQAHFISQAAARTLAGIEQQRLVKDHAIPVSVLRDLIFSAPRLSVEILRTLLLENYHIGVLTADEDAQVTAAGLRSCMPKGWATGQSPFARYDYAGITPQDLGERARSLGFSPMSATTSRARLMNSVSFRAGTGKHNG